MERSFSRLAPVLLVLPMLAPWAVGQPPPAPMPAEVAAQAPAPADIQAERLESREGGRYIDATGNVVVTQGDSVLQADHMTVDTETQDVRGEGNVHIQHDGRVYDLDRFQYNLKTRQGDFIDVDAQEAPWYLSASDTQRLSREEYLLHDATITTCEGDNPEFFIRTRETRVETGKEMRSKHVFFYLGGVPFFYLPYVKTNLSGDKTNLDVTPGYSSRMGAFLLTAYNYRLNDYFSAATRLDYRNRRGIAVGQDLYWNDPVADAYKGEARVYYLDDDRPYEDAEDEAATGDLVDNERYRVKVRHQQNVTDIDTLRIRGDYLSDPDILEDFFDREFRYNTQPENYAILTHWDPNYNASLNVNRKVNDFYSNINRLPEFTFDVPSLQLGDTSFYYTSRNSAALLEADFADQVATEDYESGRLDTDHTVYYYSKHFGFLNVIPRARYAGTYYSEVPEVATVVDRTVTTNEFGEVVTSETERQEVTDGGSDLRNVYELGMESSFKAFRVLDNVPRGHDVGRRHVVEPFINYTYIPEPNRTPDEVYRFDAIDLRNEVNDLLFGARNKLQTKRNGAVHDLIDLSLYSIYNVEKTAGDTDSIDDIFWDLEHRWFPGFWIDIDGNYDLPSSELETINTQAYLRFADNSSVSVEHRYRVDARDLVGAELNLWPGAKWSYTGYVRYNLEESDLEEHSHMVSRRTECLGFGIGVREIDEDITVWGQVWLLAFPRSVADLGR
jgi:LPS-assembly protein